MTVGTANFAELLWPGIKDFFQDGYKRYEPIFPKITVAKTSDKEFEKYQGIIGTPVAGLKPQGQSIMFVDPRQGYSLQILNITYGIGSSVTWEMASDQQYDLIEKIPRFLADSMREAEEITAHAMFNNGFSTVNSADGVSWFNTAHPLGGAAGGTLSNMGQSGVTYALSLTSLEQAVNFMGLWTDDQGMRINLKPHTLVVPTNLQFTARKLMETAAEVGTANNTKNVIAGMFKVVVSPFLTDTDGWFLLSSEMDRGNGPIFQRREDADLQKDAEFPTRNMLFSSAGRWGTGVDEWRSAWGSQGA